MGWIYHYGGETMGSMGAWEHGSMGAGTDWHKMHVPASRGVQASVAMAGEKTPAGVVCTKVKEVQVKGDRDRDRDRD